MTDFRSDVLRTLNPEVNDLLLNAVLGLVGESGEAADLLKKWRFQGHELNIDRMISELGDVRYYLELAAYSLGVTMEQVEQLNIKKRRDRYPDGFSAERSSHRSE